MSIMTRTSRLKKQHKPIGFGDAYDPPSVEGHRNAVNEARETREYNKRMKEIEAERKANKPLTVNWPTGSAPSSVAWITSYDRAFADVHRGRQPRTRRVRKVYAADRHALCCLGCGSNGSSTPGDSSMRPC